jgi:hypothetical protein
MIELADDVSSSMVSEPGGGASGAAISQEVRARVAGTRDASRAALSREVGAGATGTCCALEGAIRREAGAGA